MKTLTFSNGDKMPLFGLGTWRSTPEEAYTSVLESLKAGYRHIDCAYIYGNEDTVGKALKDAFAQNIVKREDIFITSKLWNDSHLPEHVKPALEKTLKDLGINYIDLYLIHWPVALKHGTKFPTQADQFLSLEQAPIATTWEKMEEYAQEGLCKHIGVSNFSIKKLEDLMKTAKIKPEMNQIETNPYFQQVKLVEFCQSHNIHVTAYAPLGSNKNSSTNNLLEDPTLVSIAEKHSCTAAQVALSWGMNRNTVVIPKSAHAERIRSNFKSQEVELDQEDMNSITKLERNNRLTTGDGWTGVEGSPYTFKELWNE